MENGTIALDSTVRSQDSNNSKKSKNSSASDSKPESCLESKHSKEILISEKQQRQPHPRVQQHPDQRRRLRVTDPKDESNILMFTSCAQLLLGVVLVVFGILVLVHGAALGGSGAGLWAGVGALVAGALGVVATLATTNAAPSKANSSFSTAHLAACLVALALSNMAAITALTAIVRDSQRTPEVTLLIVPGEDGDPAEIEGGWAGLLASIGLLVTSIAELLVSGYSCLTLTPKLCGCLRTSNTVDEVTNDGRLKTRNMVHQWVTAQTHHVPKSQPIYVVQSVLPMHPMIQSPYAMPGAPAKFPAGFVPAGPLSIAPAYGAVPILSHMPYAARPPSQIIRSKQKRHISMEHEDTIERKKQNERKTESPKRMSSIGEDQVDLAQTYTGLDKKISEEFISIAMDPERKSKASSNHGSEIGTAKTT